MIMNQQCSLYLAEKLFEISPKGITISMIGKAEDELYEKLEKAKIFPEMNYPNHGVYDRLKEMSSKKGYVLHLNELRVGKKLLFGEHLFIIPTFLDRTGELGKHEKSQYSEDNFKALAEIVETTLKSITPLDIPLVKRDYKLHYDKFYTPQSLSKFSRRELEGFIDSFQKLPDFWTIEDENNLELQEAMRYILLKNPRLEEVYNGYELAAYYPHKYQMDRPDAA